VDVYGAHVRGGVMGYVFRSAALAIYTSVIVWVLAIWTPACFVVRAGTIAAGLGRVAIFSDVSVPLAVITSRYSKKITNLI
jgi:hypothetical protein